MAFFDRGVIQVKNGDRIRDLRIAASFLYEISSSLAELKSG